MRKAAASASPPSPPSPERAKLADAIAALRAAEANHAALVAADQWDTGYAWKAQNDAQEALDQARAALENAHQNATLALVDIAMGATPAPRVTARDARAAVAAAEDELAAASAARQIIRDRIKPASDTVLARQWGVEKAADAVVRAETSIDTLLADMDTLFRQIADKGRLLEWLTGQDRIPRNGPEADPRTSYAYSLLAVAPLGWTLSGTPHASPLTDAWKTALEALKTDASAPLPGVAG